MEENISPPVPGWVARLDGHKSDLAACEQSLKSPFDPSCERVMESGKLFWALRSSTFNHCQTADEVRVSAITLIKHLNGVLKLTRDAEPLKFDGVSRIDEGGQIHTAYFAEFHDRARATDSFILAEFRDAQGDLVPPPPPELSVAQKWMKAAESCGDIADALRHFGQPTNWYDMWTTYEIIEDAIWNATPNQSRPKGDTTKKRKPRRVLSMSREWVSENDFEKFAESCNYHRHGARTQPKPNQNATRDEARGILVQILRGWLNKKVP